MLKMRPLFANGWQPISCEILPYGRQGGSRTKIKKRVFFLLEALSRETDTGTKKIKGCSDEVKHHLEVANIGRLSQEPFHLARPRLNRHVKDLLFKLNHEPTQNTGIDLANKN